MNDERRGFQRLNLVRPLDGWFGDFAVRLIEVSAKGAFMESDEPIPAESRALLRFWWHGEELELLAETARHEDLRCAIVFLESSDALLHRIAESARELLRAQEANAVGDRARNVIADETLTAASAGAMRRGYVTWILGANGWKHRASLLPDQPSDGFTISAAEPDEQVQLLCSTYASGDAEARRLTRMLAEISVAGA